MNIHRPFRPRIIPITPTSCILGLVCGVIFLMNMPWATAQSPTKGALLKSLEQAEQTNDLAMQAQLQYQLGQASLQTQDRENALERFYTSLELHQKSKDTQGQASARAGIARVYLSQGDVPRAIAQLEQAQQALEASNDKASMAEVAGLLGQAYLGKKPAEYGRAKKHLNEAFRWESELGNGERAAQIAYEIAHYDTQLKDYESALVYLRAVMEIRQNEGDPQQIADTYHAMAEVYQLQKSHPDADGLYQKSLSLYAKVQDSLGLANTLLALGWNQWEAGNEPEARAYFNRCIGMAEAGLQGQGLPSLYQSLSLAMEEISDTEAALHWQKKYAESKDEYLGIEKQQALLDLTAMYESKFEMEQIRNENQAYQLEQRNMRTVRNFLLALMLLALLLLAALYHSYQRKKKDNVALQQKNEEIQGMNSRLDQLNQQLVKEMADREFLERSSFARDHFLAIMSHKMRNPLNIINGLSQLLLSQNPKPEQANHLRTLQFSANNLAVFINDVLDFSNIETGKISFDAVNFKTREIVEGLKQHLRLPTQQKGMEIGLSFSPSLPSTLRGDPTRLEQILNNLLATLLENAQDGEIHISLDAGTADTQPFLEIQIEDKEHSLSPEQTQILQKESPSEIQYSEMPAALSGLFISKRLVELQGGKLDHSTKNGQGTHFYIRLPYQNATADSPQPNSATPEDTRHLNGRKILLVEDNKINQLVVAKMLEKWGMEVTLAGQGEEALACMEQQYFDLVLLDIQMPVMDGYRATAEIRKSPDPKVRDVPIIALTASAYLTEKEKARLFGMDDHVGKPFGPEELLGKISRLLA